MDPISQLKLRADSLPTTLETGFFSSEFKPIDTEHLLVDQTRLLQAINLATHGASS